MTLKSGLEVAQGREGLRTMTNVNQAPLPRLSKAPLVRASLVKRRYIKYLALPFLRSLKVVPFKSLGAVSYSPSIVIMKLSCIVFEIFSVKSGVTLKTGLGFVQGLFAFHSNHGRICRHFGDIQCQRMA